jgi:hypothetical protein
MQIQASAQEVGEVRFVSDTPLPENYDGNDAFAE